MNKRTNWLVLLICLLFVSLRINPAFAYTIANVDNFMSRVQANPAIYGVDFSNGDQIYKERYTIDGMLGYKVLLDKNSIISKKFDGWVIVSQSACGYYWDNVVVGVEEYTNTYENGDTKIEQSGSSVSCSREGTCNVFDIQNAIADPRHPGFGDCTGIGTIAHAVLNPCGYPAPGKPADATYTPEPPQLLQDFYPIDVCSLSIASLTVSSQTLDVTSGGSVGINGSISDSSGQAISWTIKVLDRTFSGSGASASATWDGKDASGNLVAPGSYSATLSAQTADGQCMDSKSTKITVIKPQEKDLDDCNNPCGCNETDTHSKVNLKSGNYYHSQNVISKPESLALDISYNSLESLDIPLGKGWNHSYNIRLIDATDSITLKLGGGDIRNFIRSGSSYLPEATSYDTTSIVKNSDSSYTRSFKNGLNQTFSNTGQLAAITDSNGNKSTLTYSGSDLTTVTDPTDRTLTITSSGGRISSIKDPAGRTTTFAYNGNLLTSVTDPSGNSWNYIYDANGKLTRKTNPAGFQSINDYDANGRNTSSTDSEGRTKTITYDNSTTSTVTEKDGSSWTRTFDPILNVPTATADALGNIRSKTFDSKGNLLTSTKPDGNTTSYTYDTNGNMTSLTDPLGKSTSYTYNNLGQILTETDPNGHITTKSYDTKGNLLQTIDPAGAKTVFTYNTKGKLLTITDPRLKKITLAYDANNNVTSVTDQNAKVTGFTYDVVGNMLTRKDPSNKITTYAYDAMNHLVTVTDPLGFITRITYDQLGNRTSVTDGNNKVTTYTYNYKNQPLTITDALGNITTMSYSASSCGGSCSGGSVDKLVSVTDANNNITRYEYNLNGELVKETDPRGNITSYSYDVSGRLTSRIDGNGKSTTYTYDAADRLLSRIYQDGASDTFTYDPAGNMITASNANISYTLTRDADSRITSITDNSNRKISYMLDANGNRTKMIAPDGRITNYTYDAKNNLTQLTTNKRAYSFTYDTLDRRTKLTNGAITTYTYDANSRITALDTKTSTGTVINNITHGYDKTANRTTKVEPTGTTTYSYDVIYRLIKSALGRTTEEQFTYDVTGNRTTGPYVERAYTIDQGNQLNTKTGTSYAYDNNGNLITKAEGSITWHFSYDGENRLVKVERTTRSLTTFNISTTTYKYDPFGNRINKTVNGVTTKYLYDGANILYEYNRSNVITNRYTHNLGIDDVLGIEVGGKLYFYHKDTLGSIRSITDSTQQTINTYNYDSFGNTTQTGTLVQPYAYTGREWDKETGLYYYRARTYDPVAGRFIQRDPISFAGGNVNLYGYVQNNPVNFIDPFGLDLTPAQQTSIQAAAQNWSQSNVPYQWGGSTKKGADCGGAVSGVYKQAGVNVGRLTSQGFKNSPLFSPAEGVPQIGDVGIYSGHVVIYGGSTDAGDSNKDVWSASHTGGPVFGPADSSWFGNPAWYRYNGK